jgi:hypothetical protein
MSSSWPSKVISSTSQPAAKQTAQFGFRTEQKLVRPTDTEMTPSVVGVIFDETFFSSTPPRSSKLVSPPPFFLIFHLKCDVI